MQNDRGAVRAPCTATRIRHEDIVGHIQEAKRQRSEAMTAAFRAFGRGVLGLLTSLSSVPLLGKWARGLASRAMLMVERRREYRRVRNELLAYSGYELTNDLRINPSEIDGIAAEAAAEHVALVARHGRRPLMIDDRATASRVGA